jgi:hypothetical protein
LSDVGYYIAAKAPNRPPAPIYVSSTATSTTLHFLEPEIKGGSPITGFKLYVDTLSEIANYQLIFSGMAYTYTVDAQNDGLLTGTTYRYVLQATNVFGDSPLSEEIRVALGSLPLAPNAPQKIEELSSKSAITV